MSYYDMSPANDSDVALVRQFHEKFNQPVPVTPSLPPEDYLAFRLDRIYAEFFELDEAAKHRDLVDVTDALVDIVYLALGTAIACGVPWERVFAVVHRANMKKEAVVSAEASRFGHALDIVKPTGWVPPEATIKAILLEALARKFS